MFGQKLQIKNISNESVKVVKNVTVQTWRTWNCSLRKRGTVVISPFYVRVQKFAEMGYKVSVSI